jgi:4-hydroxy-3-methylbut-2-enyl diphosphate reductase
MEVRLAQYSGFCFGVRRAVSIIENALKENKDGLYSIGPLIHNPQEVERLSCKGLKVVNTIPDIDSGVAVIPTHGIDPSLIERMRLKKIRLIDATCPYVLKVQNIAKSLKQEGYSVVIVGDKEHPEIKALVGLAGPEAVVVNNPREIDNLKLKGRIGIISQTTQSKGRFLKSVVKLMKADYSEVKIFNTICDDALKRQQMVFELAKSVELMLILGGRESANTRRLAEVSRKAKAKTHHIETPEEINPRWLKQDTKVGIASGASTPDWIIRQILKKIEEISKKP